jgi:beta-glucosidase
MIDDSRALKGLLDRLSLDDKVRLLTGRDFWTTWPLPQIGLRSIVFSDGPSGVRGEIWDERSPSLNLPSATALSSSWDLGIARRYGAVVAGEARRKNVDVILGPTINLHRSPLGGRHFEAFSEDPTLTGALASAYVAGVQERGVAATPKHYVANDFETERFTVDVEVTERALREIYLLPFESAVVDAHAWVVMSAYNSINGATASENDLLESPLNDEWGFDGVVVSDWTAVRSINSARYSQDLAMPGPDGAWGEKLVSAVRRGDVDIEAINRKVLRLLHLAARVGALRGFDSKTRSTDPIEDGVEFAREAAAAGSVLLQNNGELPWAVDEVKSIAVIGNNARFARTQGGGSATVLPSTVISPLDGVRELFAGKQVTYAVGAVVQQGVAELPPASLINPHGNTPGVRVRFLDAEGIELFAEDRLASGLVYFGGDAPVAASSSVELETVFNPTTTERLALGFAAVGTARIYCDGVKLLEASLVAENGDLGAALLAPPSASAEIDVIAGRPISIRAEYDLGTGDGDLGNAFAFTLGIEPLNSDPDELIAEAVRAAETADIALVVVGTNSRVETEGEDRKSLALPGRQDDLVRAVAAVNRRTVVVVNSGSPVLLPWRDEVSAILVGYFGGQEFGHAIADILSGRREPGGRLPTTWPSEESDAPVLGVTPEGGVLRYSEGIHVGYRAWLKAGRTPAFPFGHGLGFTTWSISNLRAVSVEGGAFDVEVDIQNTGGRNGKQIVQAYLERPTSDVDRPVRWLVAFETCTLDAGEIDKVKLVVPRRAFANWDRGWKYEPGTFTLRVGTSADELSLSSRVDDVRK